MAAQIGKDQPVARDQRLRDRAPELMIGGKRMKQNNRRAAAQDFVENFCVAAVDPLHAEITGQRLPCSRLPAALFYVVVTCWPAGAVSASGSFGITIHATMYAHRPTVGGIRATISHTTRTTVTSISKYSATPAHTPAIFRPVRGRTSRLRAVTAPTRFPQYAHRFESSCIPVLQYLQVLLP